MATHIKERLRAFFNDLMVTFKAERWRSGNNWPVQIIPIGILEGTFHLPISLCTSTYSFGVLCRFDLNVSWSCHQLWFWLFGFWLHSLYSFGYGVSILIIFLPTIIISQLRCVQGASDLKGSSEQPKRNTPQHPFGNYTHPQQSQKLLVRHRHGVLMSVIWSAFCLPFSTCGERAAMARFGIVVIKYVSNVVNTERQICRYPFTVIGWIFQTVFFFVPLDLR